MVSLVQVAEHESPPRFILLLFRIRLSLPTQTMSGNSLPPSPTCVPRTHAISSLKNMGLSSSSLQLSPHTLASLSLGRGGGGGLAGWK